ncbi:MAG: cytochrome P450 [Jatrophihabitans sp.]
MTIQEDTFHYPFAGAEPMQPPCQWAQARESGPLVDIALPSGDHATLVTQYKQARALLGDARFTRQVPADGGVRIAATEDGGVFSRQAGAGMAMFEGPGHLRWRRLVAKAFTIRRVEGMRAGIQQIAGELVDGMIAAGPPADLVSAIGDHLPVRVIGSLLGVPPEDHHRFRSWSDAILTLTKFSKQDADAARMEFGTYLAGLIEAKRADPGDDLLSELTQISDADDGRLELVELVITGIALLVAGHETTANMIGKMMAMALAEPSRYAEIVADRSIVPGAVEEFIRFDTNPSLGVPRYVTEDIDLCGTTVPEGATVIVSPAIANRDPRRFPDADQYDPRRENNQHLSFGAGPHFCIGAPLARVELQVVLDTLARRLPTLSLAVLHDELRVKSGLIVVGFDRVPVQW